MAAGETETRECGEALGQQERKGLDQTRSVGKGKGWPKKYSLSRRSSNITDDGGSSLSDRAERPPLPPRPSNINLLALGHTTPSSSLHVPKRSTRPQLQSQATTAISRTDIQTQSYSDGSRETYAHSNRSTPSGKSFRGVSPTGQLRGLYASEGEDSASIRSYAPTAVGDVESLLGDVVGAEQLSPAWRLLSSHVEGENSFEYLPYDVEEPNVDFCREFDELDGLDQAGDNEGMTSVIDQELGAEYRDRRTFESLEV